MERDIRINQTDLVQQFPDQFAREKLFNKSKGAWREYLINNEWTQGPEGKPEATRVVFPDTVLMPGKDRLDLSSNVYQAWRSLMELSVDEPVKGDVTIDRLLRTLEGPYELLLMVGGPSTAWTRKYYSTQLFVPWGVRPEGNFGKPEEDALNRIQEVRNSLRKNDIGSKVLLMPADLYATEVNKQVNKEQARKYFEQVAGAGRDRGFNVVPWSAIREEYMDDYQRLAAELTIDAVKELVPKYVIESAKKAAGRRSGFTTEAEIDAAAFRYLRERLCEAVIIEEKYKPIKVSAVAKYKDNFVDRELPRVYVMPSELQFPWLK